MKDLNNIIKSLLFYLSIYAVLLIVIRAIIAHVTSY